jgi:hypothetical protein
MRGAVPSVCRFRALRARDGMALRINGEINGARPRLLV